MKNKKNSDNNNLIILIALVVLVIVGVVLLIIKGVGNKKDNKENSEPGEVENFKENQIVDAYNVSKEEAIGLVRNIFNGDVYDFSCEIKGADYIVTVKNRLTGEVYEYKVDPINKSFYEITDNVYE
jgi:hypothetical protein